ncbi:DarT ssDNA thymidine ADP-ribosyltransferase family protein [Pseudomonas qingdaonensis]|uniref:DarT ssDNA thymidine ADP-ribosyltransferase family protein n=1 Tax=Pseudomonas qingdaonensis TaxID=2056231 RepID=UPI00242CDC38|nr:DarT ssDNA thymidine ADP-ribosyltransferase family protein [Pseudomonas qingdaonensis]
MSIEQFCKDRGIESVVHFTTNRGALGIFASNALKSRQRLDADNQLKHIFQPNAQRRNKDAAWLDYANLSISRINTSFFNYSGNWHREQNFFWCIFDFSPEIMQHDGVWFTTTNNIYTGVRRGQGVEGLSEAFLASTTQWSGKVITRPDNHPPSLPTCAQAEILYPGEVSTAHLQRVYARCDSDSNEIAAQMYAVGHRVVPVIVNPDLFDEIK